jgi:ABC-2 type transport system ATP-binding protein
MSNVAIHAHELALSYRGQQVLSGISVDVPEGAVVGLIGRNGAGKSTLLRCLTGLTLADKGHCSLLGCSSEALDDGTRARLGYVSQTGDLIPWLTVWQNITTIGGFYPQWQAERAHALCARLQLDERKRADRLSVGDQQKLALVLAMAHDPDLLILDEPVASLDPVARREFMRMLFDGGESRARPRTVLLSSHLLTDLERVVSHVVFLRDGRVQLHGRWETLQEERATALDELFVELNR